MTGWGMGRVETWMDWSMEHGAGRGVERDEGPFTSGVVATTDPFPISPLCLGSSPTAEAGTLETVPRSRGVSLASSSPRDLAPPLP